MKNGDGLVRFTWREWAGIFSAMVLAAGLAAAAPLAKIGELVTKDELAAVLATERQAMLEDFRRELAHEREMWAVQLAAHAEKDGHENMKGQWLEHDRRIGKLEGGK